MSDKPDLDQELDRLQERLPNGMSRLMRKLRGPAVAPYRVPVGVALTVGGCFGFLPVLGFWMTPLGLALLAQEVPVMRPPFARLVARVNRRLSPER
jgi:hypothetical protein